jgi:hypothetical protein
MGRPPTGFFKRICWYVGVYYLLSIYYVSALCYTTINWIKKKLEPKHKELNWLRKLAGIPPK